MLNTTDGRPAPLWVVREMRSRGRMARDQPSGPHIDELADILQRFASWSSTPLLPCRTSAATVRLVHLAGGEQRCIVWDESFFNPIEACVALALSNAARHDEEDLQLLLVSVIFRSVAERVHLRTPFRARGPRDRQPTDRVARCPDRHRHRRPSAP